MHPILKRLDPLQSGAALFVYNKRITVFLLPELAQQKFDYSIKEISTDEAHILIFKD
jgi:hypothetical protein